jgi:serine/threonine-protein kinase RsbW
VPSRFHELSVGANGPELRRASEWLDATCQQHHVPQASVERLILCLNEVVANVISHGGGGARAEPIKLLLEVALEQGQGKADVTVSDAGRAFDPLSVPPRDKPGSLKDAPLGGLGLVMLRRCSDSIHYRHEGGRNHLTFGARWEVQ